MFRYFIVFFLLTSFQAVAQRQISADEAVNLTLQNQRNTRPASLSVRQQQELLAGAAAVDNPQVFGEATPYEPLIIGVQQSFSLPGVYRSRRQLQQQRIRLAELQMQGNLYDLKRDVRLSYLQLQFLYEREKLLRYQDSIYAAIKTASKRFFDAGQINKLEELQSTTQADAVRNELLRASDDLAAEKEIFRFYTALTDSFTVEPLQTYLVEAGMDTAISNIQQQILQQQIAVNENSLRVERKELLPQLQAGVSFPTTKDYERSLGYQFGISIPIWVRQNRSRIKAARTGIEMAKAEQQLGQLRLNAQYRQAVTSLSREGRSLMYFNTTALPQARAIIETSQRLFSGGELNYIESLRNLQSAFDIFFNHIETHRAYNEAVIQIRYLNGGL